MTDSELRETRERLARLEGEYNVLASREWVHDELGKVKDSQIRTEHSVSMLARTVEGLAEKVTGVFSAHDKFLQEESVRRAKEHEENMAVLRRQTFNGFISSMSPVIQFLMALFAFGGILWGAIVWGLQNVK